MLRSRRRREEPPDDTDAFDLPPPSEPPETQGCLPLSTAAPGLEGPRVLLVEDDAMVREVLAIVLTRGGARVTAAADGESGLKCLREGEFQTLVTDLNMPGMSGLEFVRAAREEGFLGRVVVVSGFPGEQSEEMTTSGGVDVVLLKPVQPAVLLRAVNQPGDAQMLATAK